LADRSGKGRLNLKHEEQQRKQIQKDTRFLLSELSKKLAQWEINEGCKFDESKLSPYGLEVLFEGKKSKSSIGDKTALMHLEAGIQVGANTTRRNSSENGTKRESFESENEIKGAVTLTGEKQVVTTAPVPALVATCPVNNDVMCTPMADRTNGNNRLSMTGTVKRNPFDRVTNTNKLRASILKAQPTPGNASSSSLTSSNPLSPENVSAALGSSSEK
jgi:hypothetical protein